MDQPTANSVQIMPLAWLSVLVVPMIIGTPEFCKQG
jgi:hypothetical protein